MAQNISLLGADYPSVPAVLLPKTGGGTARFTDVSPTTAVPSDVTPGKIFFLADGTQATGNNSGGGVSGWTVAKATHAEGSVWTAPSGCTSLPTAMILYRKTTLSNPLGGEAIALLKDSSTFKVWKYNNGNAVEETNPSIGIYYNNGEIVFDEDNSYGLVEDGQYYDLICVFGGTGNFTFRTDTYQPASGVTSAQFSVEENPPLYFIGLQSSVALAQYHRVQTVIKADANDVDELCGTNFYTSTFGHLESSTQLTETYSNGTLTVATNNYNDGGYFHNPGTYTLFYALQEDLDGTGSVYQRKTVTPSTSQQIIEADTGYEALSRVTVEPIPSQYIIPSGNKAITSNGNNIDVSEFATVSVAVPTGGGEVNIDTKTMTNSNDQSTSIQFTGLEAEPKAFFIRLTSQLTRSSSYSYYYVTDMRYDGTNHNGNYYRRSNGTFYNDTTHYNHSYSNGTLTISSSASRGSAGGSFYNGTYELVYVY